MRTFPRSVGSSAESARLVILTHLCIVIWKETLSKNAIQPYHLYRSYLSPFAAPLAPDLETQSPEPSTAEECQGKIRYVSRFRWFCFPGIPDGRDRLFVVGRIRFSSDMFRAGYGWSQGQDKSRVLHHRVLQTSYC